MAFRKTGAVCHMVKTLFTAFTILISFVSYSQKNITFPVIGSTHRFNWKNIEQKPLKSTIDKFIKDSPKEFLAYRQNNTEIGILNLDNLRKDLHFIDLNGDGRNDVIFEGQSGGEIKEIGVFINNGLSYKKVFTGNQEIIKMDWQKGRLSNLYIVDTGCCADYLEFHMIYKVDYTKTNIRSFKQIYQSVSIYQGTIPITLLKNTFRFEILNDGYKIRSAPKIDDKSFQPWDTDQTNDKGSGNSFGKLVKGAKGIAIAKEIDKTGREWIYVEIEEQYLPKNDIIYIENKFPTKITGWISSRFIKTQ
jgi:hypothetical protein